MLSKPSWGHAQQALARHLLACTDFACYPKPTEYKANHLTRQGQPHGNALQDIRCMCLALTRWQKHLQGKTIPALSQEEKLYLFSKEAEQLSAGKRWLTWQLTTLSWHDCSNR